MELYARFAEVHFIDILVHSSNSNSASVSRLYVVAHMKQRALPVFGHTILYGRSNGQKDSVSVCTQEVSLYLFSRPEYIRAFADDLPARERSTAKFISFNTNLFPSLASFSRGWRDISERDNGNYPTLI